MAKQHRRHNHSVQDDGRTAWILTTKRAGDCIAGWTVGKIFENNIRKLDNSERCAVTSYCYPTGAKLVRAKLLKH